MSGGGDRHRAGRAIFVVDFALEHTDELVAMWRTSFERALSLVDPHPISQQRAYLLEEIVPNHRVRVAVDGERIVGFAAASRECLAQLYVRVGDQGRGIGTRLLRWAKDQSGGRLWLHTFERNEAARRFYERHGFRIVGRGFEPTWQLEDLRYEWTDDGMSASSPARGE